MSLTGSNQAPGKIQLTSFHVFAFVSNLCKELEVLIPLHVHVCRALIVYINNIHLAFRSAFLNSFFVRFTVCVSSKSRSPIIGGKYDDTTHVRRLSIRKYYKVNCGKKKHTLRLEWFFITSVEKENGFVYKLIQTVKRQKNIHWLTASWKMEYFLK